jgi:RNA recognition motif-containing protein
MSTSRRRKPNPNELFVGNLSYFCKEDDLFSLVASALMSCREIDLTHGAHDLITSLRIVYSDGYPQRSLLFGFVAFKLQQDCFSVIQRLNGELFMGRKLRFVIISPIY